MKVEVLLFGISKDLVGKPRITISLPKNTVKAEKFKSILIDKHNKLSDIEGFALAVNTTYAKNNDKIKDNDEVAVIPPTNGG